VLFRSYEDGAKARALAEFAAAIEADPSFGVAYGLHGLADIALHGYALAPREVKLKARAQAVRGVELSPDEAHCHGILCYVDGLLEEYELAESTARRAVHLNPCDADALLYMALAVLVRGRPAECLEWLDRAMDVNPLWPSYYDETLADALFDLGRYEEAIRIMHRIPRLRARQEMQLAACHAYLGQRDAARRHVGRARELEPDWNSVDKFRGEYNFESKELLGHMIRGVELALRMADYT
jgi:tetratricopeptide (TPR) repeat protein